MLAEGTAQTSITMNRELLEKCKAAAKAEGRSLSNWLEQLVKRTQAASSSQSAPRA